MASLINTYFAPVHQIDPGHIVFTNGVTALNSLVALSLTDGNSNDGILLGQPIYGAFYGDLSTLSECQLIYTPFHGEDQFGPGAVTCYEKAFLHAQETGVTVKALVISNPHNPLGQCYSRETIEALMRFCHNYRLHLISDEIYALSVYGEGAKDRFVSALSIDPASIGVDPELVHVLYGVSKDLALAGLRLGCLISHNEKVLQAALSIR